ncbi:MAG: LPP20 family lipoprotein [Deltaproteobacteria bacterium]|nr:LPP20 family lipoprotein [Deltaproteobacteria bacterium]
MTKDPDRRDVGCDGRGGWPDGWRRGAALLALLLYSGALGCGAWGEGVPGWVQGEPAAGYPKASYVTAIGTGATLDEARAGAKSELSRIFSAELSSEAHLVEEETTSDGESRSESRLLVDTRIRSDVELEGVEVPLHWRDARRDEVWALAVLERNAECLRIRAQGRDLSTRLEAWTAEAEAASHPLAGVRSARQAVRVGVALDGLQARSRVLGSQCLDAPRPSTGVLFADLEARLESLRFVVEARELDARGGAPQETLPQLRERIARDLTELGFQVGPGVEGVAIPVVARLRLRRVERGTQWVEYRWEGFAEVGHPVEGEPSILVAQGEGSESHPEASTARLRARHMGERDLAHALRTRLEHFLMVEEEG